MPGTDPPQAKPVQRTEAGSRYLRLWATALGAAGALIAALCLVGWLTGVEALTTFGVSRHAMGPLTATLLLLIGLGVLTWSRAPASATGRVTTVVAAAVATAVALAVLMFQLTGAPGWVGGLTDWPLGGALARSSSLRPSLPSTQSMLALMLMGISLLVALTGDATRRRSGIAGFIAVAGVSVGSQALLGHVFGVGELVQVDSEMSTGISLPTATAVVLIGTALLILVVGSLLDELRGDPAAWRVTVRLLPAALIIPLLRVALVQRTFAAGGTMILLGTAGAALVVAVLVALVWATSLDVHRIYRQQAELIEALPVAAVIDQGGVIVHANRSAHEMLAGRGLAGPADIETGSRDTPAAPGQSAPAAARTTGRPSLASLLRIDRATLDDLRGAALGRAGITAEVICPDSSGAEATFEISAQRIRWDERPATLLVLIDRTEQKRSEIALRDAWAAANQANAAKSEFLSRMSHELRTPLNAVLGFAQLMNAGSPTEEDRESIESILKAGRHLLQLINEVLELSRIESDRINLSPEPVRIGDLIGQALEIMAPLAEAASVDMTCGRAGCPGCGRYVLADRQRTLQVLLNLLSNAVKYNTANGSVSVRCHQEQGSDAIRVSVTDTGPGLAPDQIAKLFDPFERLGREHGPVEGTGIGLAVARRLVEAMGGHIGVTSNLGQGSTFWCELPLAEGPIERFVRLNGENGEALKPAAELATPSDDKPDLEPVHILHIEDNLDNLRLIERVLRLYRRPIELLSAMQGRLGTELAREHHPDLILLDLHLPDISGDSVLAQLMEDPDTATIPVVIISADASPNHINRLLNAGAAAYLTKPIEFTDLTQQLERLLPPPTPRDIGPGRWPVPGQ